MDALLYKLEPEELKKLQICGPIVNYHRNYIVIEVKRKAKEVEKKSFYHVEFRPNFYSNAMAQRALRRIEKTGYENFLLNFTSEALPVPVNMNFPRFENVEWLNKNVGANGPQSQAVKSILNRKNFPSPYVVFGPPGTGKTSTLVEAVAQIVTLLPSSKVLVTVNSNSACDEIGERLLQYVGGNKMFRFYSPSFAKKMDRVNPKLKPRSNLKYNYHIQPSVQELLSYNVIIATLVNSGRLVGLGASHFDFILIDECASSAEPYVNIPLMNAIKENRKFKASVVLLGDPKQLGQIMRTYHSERYGFNISMMERVMKMESYQYGTDGYDPRFIVQLTDNFRSHHSILSYSNKQFYNSELKAKQKESVANFALDWKLLPNPKVPIIFHASWTKSELEGTSQYNSGDIHIVKKYVYSLLNDGVNGKKVLPKDIGIISPYASQREKLKETFKMGVEIGTVEYFQGREKLIIIVSTVRSKTASVGFLKNEKRLNVALTRAKALLIVIGNPETLGKNVFWRKFIQLCCNNKATVGKVPSWVRNNLECPDETEEDEDDAVRLEEMMNGMSIED